MTRVVTRIKGELEIDHERGVIYFHIGTAKEVNRRNVATALRVCGLPTPIPQIQGQGLDITHMHGTDWGGDKS